MSRPCAVVVSAHAFVERFEPCPGLGDYIKRVEQIARATCEPIEPG